MFLSANERSRPDHIRSALIATLFGRASNVAMLALAAIICGWIAIARSGCWMSVGIATLEVVVICARCALILSYQRADPASRIGDAEAWLVWFGWLALASSSFWGALCFLALATAHDPVLYALPVLSTVGIAGSVAARNSAVPRLAKAQLVLSLSPILAGSLLADDHGFRALLLLVPAMAIGLFVLIEERSAQFVALMETQHELDRLSHVDSLTEIANRRSLDRDIERRLEERRPFALLMIDVDHFKRFNDTHGHPGGDIMLRRLAALLKAELRCPADLVARYGGEEFAVLLDDVEPARAAAIAQRIRSRIATAFSASELGEGTTVSIGVAHCLGATSTETLVHAADRALYRAKRAGRDRVELSEAA